MVFLSSGNNCEPYLYWMSKDEYEQFFNISFEENNRELVIEKLLDFFTKPDASSLYAPMFKTLSGNTIFLCQNSQQSNRKNDFERYYFD